MFSFTCSKIKVTKISCYPSELPIVVFWKKHPSHEPYMFLTTPIKIHWAGLALYEYLMLSQRCVFKQQP